MADPIATGVLNVMLLWQQFTSPWSAYTSQDFHAAARLRKRAMMLTWARHRIPDRIRGGT